MKAAAYIRVSTARQSAEGFSLDEQERRVRAWASENGAELEVFSDAGVSGRRDDRPALTALLSRLNEFDAVVITKLDRLGRSNRHLFETFGRLEDADVTLVSLGDSLDTSTAHGKLQRSMLTALAEFESDLMGERIAGVSAAKAREGRYHGGPRPLGYDFDPDGGLIVNEAEAPVIRRVFAEFIAGRSRRAIARGLNEDGIKSGKAGRWTHARVDERLRNPLYFGEVRLHGERYRGEHDPLIDRETWDRAQALLAAPSSRRRGRRPHRHLFVRGFLRCLFCESAMHPRTQWKGDRRYEYYRCSGHDERSTECDMTAVPREAVDQAVFDYFARDILDPAATLREFEAERTRALDEARARVAEAENDAAEAEARLARIKREYQDGELTAAEWRAMRDELEEERSAALEAAKQLRRPLEALEAQEGAERLRQDWAAIRRAVAGAVNDAETVEAVRAALARVFDHFLIGRVVDASDGDPPELLRNAAADLAGEGIEAKGGELVLHAEPRPEYYAPPDPKTALGVLPDP